MVEGSTTAETVGELEAGRVVEGSTVAEGVHRRRAPPRSSSRPGGWGVGEGERFDVGELEAGRGGCSARYRTAPAALFVHCSATRMYRRTMALERWPVCAMIARSSAPARAAEVARPDRRE